MVGFSRVRVRIRVDMLGLVSVVRIFRRPPKYPHHLRRWSLLSDCVGARISRPYAPVRLIHNDGVLGHMMMWTASVLNGGSSSDQQRQCRVSHHFLDIRQPSRPPDTCIQQHSSLQWCNGKAFGLAISRSQVQILLEATMRNNLRQVVYTYVPLSPSSITWYRPKGGDALRLGR